MEKNTNLTPANVNNSLAWGWEKMKQYFLPLLLIIIVISMVDSPLNIVKNNKDEYTSGRIILEILVLAYAFLLRPIFAYSADYIFIQAVRDEKLEVRDIVIGFNNYLNIILSNLLVISLIGISLVALIIPGIIVACRLAFVSFLIMDKNMDPIASIETSWKMTNGYTWQIFVLGVTSIFIFFLGLLALIVGILPAIIWIKASFASLYEAILIEGEE